MNLALGNQNADMNTNATRSIKSNVINLVEDRPGIVIKDLIEVISREYITSTVEKSDIEFKLVTPTEQSFSGFNKIRDQFISWDWCYGKTPKFTISEPKYYTASAGYRNLQATVIVKGGRIMDIKFNTQEVLTNVQESNKIRSWIGQRFSEECLVFLNTYLQDFANHTEACPKDMVALHRSCM